jgi:hypothetical protein
MTRVTIQQPSPQHTIDAARRRVARMPQQLRFAASVAANAALVAARTAVQQRMPQVFNQPTPYTVRGAVALQPMHRDNLSGSVALATDTTAAGNVPAGKPLLAEVRGGSRRLKRSEVLLQRAGLLPVGYLTVPGRGARLDAYGNMARGQILEVLSWFQTYAARPASAAPGRRNSWRDNISDKGKARKRAGTRNRAGVEYFALRPGDKQRLPPGIYRRQVAGRFVGPVGQRPVAVLLFVRRAQYTPRLDFAAVAEAAVAATFPQAWPGALRRALETAR